MIHPRLELSLLAGALLWLAACGDGVGQPIREALAPPAGTGGAGNGGVPSNSYCQDVANWSESDAAGEQELLTALDTLRLFGVSCDSSGLGVRPPSQTPSATSSPALGGSPELRCSARRHARDMSQRSYFSLISPEGETPATRMQLAGYDSSVLLEVIARDQPQAYLVLQGLLRGGGEDCQVLLDPNVVAIGVGKFGNFWTVDLGGARAP